jgi:hypothetical protein
MCFRMHRCRPDGLDAQVCDQPHPIIVKEIVQVQAVAVWVCGVG